jgi:hypothetical protein
MILTCQSNLVKYVGKVLSILLPGRTRDIVQTSVGESRSKLLALSPPPKLAESPGIKGSRAGQQIIKTLASKRELIIQLGTSAPVRSRIVIKRNGENGAKLSSKEITTLAKSVSKEEADCIQTTLSALLTMKNSALKLAMDERFARIVIELLPTTVTIKERVA